MIDIVIADDATDLRRLLKMLLEKTGEVRVVGEASDGTQVLSEVARLMPDAVLLDLSMPVRSGIDVIPELSAVCRVVVLSGYSPEEFASECISRGASAYVEKGEPVHVILAALLGKEPSGT